MELPKYVVETENGAESRMVVEARLDREKLEKIETICRRHCSPAVVTSTHILALNVLKIIEGKG